MTRLLLLVAALGLGLGLLLTACARQEDETWSRVAESGVLRVGMDASFPPFESIEADGTLSGLDVALAQELGRRLGVETQFVANLPYDGLYDALTARRVDVVISSLVIVPERQADFAYSTPYFDAGLVLVTRDDEAGRAIKRTGDLAGRVLAVEFGSTGDMEARRLARRLRGLVTRPYETADAALVAVADGQADAALVDHVSAMLGDDPARHLRIVEPPFAPEPYAVAMRADSPHLLQAINDALAAMADDGTLAALQGRYLSGGHPQGQP